MRPTILLHHGSGGMLTHKLVREVFQRHFANVYLNQMHDAARLPAPTGRLAFTTDSFVVSPLFFPGGDVGKLAVCGTVNDLAMGGAKPLYLSAAFIIEEGLSLETLERVAVSMAAAAAEAGVSIVTGDTKVVEKGAADGLFITTSGIGVIPEGIDIGGGNARPGDLVIASGTLGDHGLTILAQRRELKLEAPLASDCAPLNGLVAQMLAVAPDIRILRDPTRGGVATALNEIARQSGVGIRLDEAAIPLTEAVQGLSEMLGLDPLYIANEGKLLAIVPPDRAEALLSVMRNHPYGARAAIIGEIESAPPGKVFMRTVVGGTRVVDMLVGDQLPRIC